MTAIVSIVTPQSAESAVNIEPGDLVRHYGTKQWGTVLQVRGPDGVPWHDSTAELLVRRHVKPMEPFDLMGEGWWSSGAIDKHVKPSPWMFFARVASGVAMARGAYLFGDLPSNMRQCGAETTASAAMTCMLACSEIDGCLPEYTELFWRGR